MSESAAIRPAVRADLPAILALYQTARDYMRQSGNPGQWGDAYPSPALLEDDIQKGQLFVLEQAGELHGVFVFFLGEEPTYQIIEDGAWPNSAPYGAIHRVAASGKVKGVFGACLAFCKAQADNIRIDTHSDNKTMRHLLEKHGFVQCGIIRVEDGTPRIAYQLSRS